jgi:HAD superfamily phosphatase (TIGR01681 family)
VSGAARLDIALLSNVVLTPVAKRVSRAMGVDVYQPHEPGAWAMELSAPDSALYRGPSRLVFVILHGAALFGEDGLNDAQAILELMADAIADATASHAGTTFVASTLDIPNAGPRPLVSRRPEAAAGAFWRRALEERGIPILELAEIAANMGRERFYNNRLWYMGAMPFSRAGEDALAVEIERIWRAVRGMRKRCLALDLDNTLWGGVLGETGTDGLQLARSGSGSSFCDFQRRILGLKESGVLLVVISKNNTEDAMRAIDTHPDMLLRSPDFAVIRANWNQKSENLRAAALELGLKTSDFVFIDDNPVERDAMRVSLPDVEVPEFPEDSARLVPFIDDVAREYFLKLRDD